MKGLLGPDLWPQLSREGSDFELALFILGCKNNVAKAARQYEKTLRYKILLILCPEFLEIVWQ
jgi:hypothetical protein